MYQIQADRGDVTITNDGATILKQMQVLHPAAKMVNIMFLIYYLSVCNIYIYIYYCDKTLRKKVEKENLLLNNCLDN